jgi:hypothetical protein
MLGIYGSFYGLLYYSYASFKNVIMAPVANMRLPKEVIHEIKTSLNLAEFPIKRFFIQKYAWLTMF